jgi:hypothetical protein
VARCTLRTMRSMGRRADCSGTRCSSMLAAIEITFSGFCRSWATIPSTSSRARTSRSSASRLSCLATAAALGARSRSSKSACAGASGDCSSASCERVPRYSTATSASSCTSGMQNKRFTSVRPNEMRPGADTVNGSSGRDAERPSSASSKVSPAPGEKSSPVLARSDRPPPSRNNARPTSARANRQNASSRRAKSAAPSSCSRNSVYNWRAAPSIAPLRRAWLSTGAS